MSLEEAEYAELEKIANRFLNAREEASELVYALESRARLALEELCSHDSKEVSGLAKKIVRISELLESAFLDLRAPTRFIPPTSDLSVPAPKEKSKTDDAMIVDAGDRIREQYTELIYDALAPERDLITKLVQRTESAVHAEFGGTTAEYTDKMHSLSVHLKDTKKPALRGAIFSGELSPEQFSRMTRKDMNTKFAKQYIIEETLASLNAFRTDVWGNDLTFLESRTRQSGLNERRLEYLNFGKHFTAVCAFCRNAESIASCLLITQEYRDAMVALKDERIYKRGACILGQPGIGKSCFVAYAVVECLRARQPVAVQVAWPNRHSYLFFSEQSVTVHSDEDWSPLRYYPGAWCFSDSDEGTEIPITPFLFAEVRVFQTTSPVFSRWKSWSKQLTVSLYCMNLWSIEDIEDLALIRNYKSSDAERMKALAREWGSVPRTLTSAVAHSGWKESYELRLNDSIGKAVERPHVLMETILGTGNASAMGSSNVFFIKPREEKGIIQRYAYTTFVPTYFIINKLIEKLNALQVAQKVQFFHTMYTKAVTRGAAGFIFEQIIHDFVVCGKPMVRCPPQDLELPPLYMYTTKDDLHATPPFYWLPDKVNNPGIDSAIVTTNAVYVIQSTISRKHKSPEKGVENLWGIMPRDKKRLPWKLLYVGPREDQTMQVSKRFAHSLKFGDGHRRFPLPVGRVNVFPDALESLSWAVSDDEDSDEDIPLIKEQQSRVRKLAWDEKAQY